MIKTFIQGKEVCMRKRDIVAALSSLEDLEGLKKAVEHIQENPELQRLEKFEDYCKFVLNPLKKTTALDEKQRRNYECTYSSTLEKLRIIVEDHGIPRRGHLNQHAEELLKAMESEKYRHLLDDEQVAISFGKVVAHVRDWKHDEKYETYLHHLHELINLPKEDTPDVARKAVPNRDNPLIAEKKVSKRYIPNVARKAGYS